MIFYKQKFLKNELNKLEKDGLLSTDQKEKIFTRYKIKPTQTNANSTLLVVFAGILFSLSIITLIGYNWEQIPAPIRTALLLLVLLCVQIALYLVKDKSVLWMEFLGILSNFILLANLALLSQIYHLGEDVAAAFLSVAFVSLLMSLVLKSGFVFWQGYVFAALAFCINAKAQIFTPSFGLFILCGFILRMQNGSKALAFVNFFALLFYLYLAPWFFNALDVANYFAFISLALPFSLLFLAFNAQSYKTYALFTCALSLIIAINVYDISNLTVAINGFSFTPFLLVLLVPALLNLALKRYFLGILGLLFWLEIFGFFIIVYQFFSSDYEFTAYYTFVQIFYSFLTLIFGAYLIKERYLLLGVLTLCTLVISRYINLLGDYIGASLIFAIFGLILLIIASKKRKCK